MTIVESLDMISRESRCDNNRESRYAAKDEDEFEDHPSLRLSHIADSWH
jgi:hypothetical protein